MSGLLCPDAYSNSNSSYYLKKGQPFTSPLAISSPDSTKVGTITENNAGGMIIQSGTGDMTLYPGTGNLYVLSPNTLTSSLIKVENAGNTTIQSTAATILKTAIGSSSKVQQGAGVLGTIYDSVYNIPPTPAPIAINPTTYTSAAVPITSDTLIGTGSLAAGLYMLQAKIFIDTTLTAGTSINCYIEDLPASPPTTYVPYSSIVITPGSLAAPVLPDVAVDATYTSAVFTVPAGKTNWKFFVEVQGSWNFGTTGNLQLQLVKLA